MRVRALLLDLDGTLADTIAALRGVYMQILAEQGIEGSEDEFQSLNGPPLSVAVGQIRERYRISTPAEVLLARWLALAEAASREARPQAGATELLSAARRHGWKTAVVTSGPLSAARSWLAAHGLAEQIDTVIGGDSVRRGKPAPDPYLAALTGLAADAADAIAIEDTPTGACAARSAGVTTFILDPQLKCRGPSGALPLARLADILPLLAQATMYRREISTGTRVQSAGNAPAPRPEIQSQINEIWQQQKSQRPDLFDGALLSVTEIVAGGIAGQWVPYSRWLAQRHAPALALGIRPLAVSGLTVCRDGLVVGRRALKLGAEQRLWELAPSGSVDGTCMRPDGTVDLAEQISRELTEELGVERGAIREIVADCMLENTMSGLIDVVLRITLDLSAHAVRQAHRQHASGEYDEIAIVHASDLPAFCRDVHWHLVDTTFALARAGLAETATQYNANSLAV